LRLLLQKPDRFFRIVAEERGWRLAKNYAVGMLFLNKDPEKAAASRRIVEEELQRETLSHCRLARCANQRRGAR
jgi:glutamate synthase (NADPH/NADH) large chain